MSGASVTWVGLDKAQNLLRGMVKKTNNLTPLMQDIASYGVSSTQSRIADEKKSPDGTPWAQHKDPRYTSRKAERSSGGLLEYSGMLIRSMTAVATRYRAEWGSNREYAARMQFGGGGVIARPYLGISDKNSKVLQRLIRSYYDN